MAELLLRLFDDFRVMRLPDHEIRMRVKKQAALLAFLCIEDRMPHQREKLAVMFWPDLEQTDARNNLRVCLTRIRRNLAIVDDCIVTTRSTIRLDSDAALTVDVREFQHHIRLTEQHEHTTRASCEHCHQQLIAALGHYQGDFLKNLSLDDCESFEDWRLFLQQELRAQAIDALEDCAEFLQHTGDYKGSGHYTRWQIKLDPLRESAHRRLMRLLFFMNNRTGALSHYTALTDLLLDELGVGPDTETRTLYAQIENGEFEKPVLVSAREVAPGRIGKLPSEVTRYIGNESVLQLLPEHLQRHRLLTITGLGGVGKSRLALQLAKRTQHQFADGVYFVRLAALRSVREIIAELATELSMQVEGGSDLVDQLHRHLQNRCVLIVLDNFEHVMEARELVSGLISATEHLRILVTSRQKLMISGEAAFSLQGLPIRKGDEDAVSAAAALFLEAAARVRLDFVPCDDDRVAIENICLMVDGHPLALELAAGWLESLTCTEIAQELKRGNDILTSELTDIPDRQRSVDAACHYSWQLLSDQRQHLFASLSVFRGAFDRQAMESITHASVQQLGELVTRSMVERRPATATYELHGLMRQFASRRLAEYAWSDKITQAHSDYYLSLIQSWETGMEDGSQHLPPEGSLPDFDNIRAAWQYALQGADLDRLRKSVSGLRKLCLINGREHELIGFIEPLIELTDARPEYKVLHQEFELDLLLALGVAYRNSKGYTDPALAQIFQRARVLSENIDTSAELFAVLYGMWSFSIVRGELDECLKIIEQWRRRLGRYATGLQEQASELTDCPTYSDPVLVDANFVVHMLEGPVYYLQGNFERARQIMQAGIRLDQPDRRAAIVANYGLNFSISGRFWLAQAQCISGYPAEALRTSDALEALALESAQPLALAFSALGMCLVSELLGEPERVAMHATRLTKMSFEHRVGQYFVHHGKMFEGRSKCQSDPAAGIRIMKQCFDKSIGSRTYFDSDTLLLVRALIDDDQRVAAASYLDQSLQVAVDTGVHTRLAETHRLRGELLLLSNRKEAAIASFSKSIEIAAAQGARLFEMRTCLHICKLLPDHEMQTRALNRLQTLWEGMSDDHADLRLVQLSELVSSAPRLRAAE